MKRMKDRRLYGTAKTTYFGWDLRDTERASIHWQRSPLLTDMEVFHWPYTFDPELNGADKAPDICVVVHGDPSDDLLTAWVEEEEKDEELTCVA